VYRQKPLAVVLPQSVEQIKQVLKICKTHNTPVVTRGAGTGLSQMFTYVASINFIFFFKKIHSVVVW
jgi:FAD/FMN-containing dehydrogenase